MCIRGMRARSVNEYIAQTFGAQYAWHRPLENGNSLSFNWSNWFQNANGPNAMPNTPSTPTPSLKAFKNLGRSNDFGSKQ